MRLLTLVPVFLLLGSRSARAAEFLNDETRTKIFENVVQEIERLDGDGLAPRPNRPESWKTTIQKLKVEAQLSKKPDEFGRVLKRLDATYPNLHAKVTLSDEYDPVARAGRPDIAVRFSAEEIKRGQQKFKYRISNVSTELVSKISESKRPAIGDYLLAINDRSMDEWSKENFIFCKHPMREQCEANFFDHFRKELLSWEHTQNLTYRIRRNDRTWTVEIPVGLGRKPSNQSPSDDLECGVEKDRYADFKLMYKGFNICLFESSLHPDKAILRIGSFVYRGVPEDEKIQSLKDEVNEFWEAYWNENASKVKVLIIDLMENGGGDTPIEWYKIFYSKPFQEQYVEYKKIPELERTDIRDAVFYGDPAREIWYKSIQATGVSAKRVKNKFLPTHPSFCVFENKSCDEGLFQPRQHQFRGEVRLLVDEWCISTCVGFVWSFKDQLKDRVKIYGFPDSGDTAYARLYLDLTLDKQNPEGFRTEVSPRPPRSRQTLGGAVIARQSVSVTRTTDSNGKVLSAIPVHVDHWVARKYRHFDEPWEQKVVKAALKK